MDKMKTELWAYMAERPVINTHSHHFPDGFFKSFTLDNLLRQTYISWFGVTFDQTQESRAAYLDKVRYKSYFIWLQKSLQELYGFDEPLSTENWEEISRKIEGSYEDTSFHLQILKEKCGYEKVILDTYWNPGNQNGHPEIFFPTFRVDPLFYGYAPGIKDHDGNDPAKLYGDLPRNITDYVVWIRRIISHKKEEGCIALKSAMAYKRGLHYKAVTKERADRIFGLKETERTTEDIVAFQDYLFQCICEISAEFGLPVQCHTGLGQLTETRAMSMKEVIARNPETKFVLFHCSFPWTEDISALLHTYPNVYPDLCWLPLLSPTAAKKMLHELIEVGTSDKICWGCDTWTSEESYGALLAIRFVLAEVLAEKIKDGYFTLADAKEIIDRIMISNAAEIYGFKQK